MNKEQIVTSFEVILEMLRDRGINIGDVQSEHINEILRADSLKQVIEIIINDMKIVYYTPLKFKWADVKKYFEDTEKFSLYILVVQENITQNNMKSINALNLPLEIHLLSRLQFNITKHVLVPKHEVIRGKESIEQVLTMYKLKNKYQLPIILKTDPIARYYGMRNGDLVKIIRKSETAGEYIMYRCCL